MNQIHCFDVIDDSFWYSSEDYWQLNLYHPVLVVINLLSTEMIIEYNLILDDKKSPPSSQQSNFW